MEYRFPKGENNPAKRPEIRAVLREQKLGIKNPQFGKPSTNKGSTWKWSAEHRKKMELHYRTVPRYNYIADRNKLKKNERKDLDSQYKEWMRAVKKRDKYTCMIRNTDCKGRLEAHHILRWADYRELRYEVKNGITLCHAHHPMKKAEEKGLQAEFQALVATSEVGFWSK